MQHVVGARRGVSEIEVLFTCVKVLVCIVEAWMCSTTLSTSGLGPVTKPILSLKQEHAQMSRRNECTKTSPTQKQEYSCLNLTNGPCAHKHMKFH